MEVAGKPVRRSQVGRGRPRYVVRSGRYAARSRGVPEAWVEDMFTEGADTDWSKPFDGARYIDPPELDEDGEPIDYDGPEVYAYFGFVEADRIW